MMAPGGGSFDANECDFRVDRGFVVKWSQLPVPLYVHRDVSSAASKNFSYAVDIWNESWNYHTGGRGRLFDIVGELLDSSVSPDEDEASNDEINMLFLDTEKGLLLPKQQGSTFIRNYLGGSIFDADITINGVDYKFYYEDKPFDYSVYTKVPKLSTGRFLASTVSESFWSRFLGLVWSFWKLITKKPTRTISASHRISKREIDSISLYVHELGHLAGLVHIEISRNNIMYPHLAYGQIRRDIGPRELTSLACTYL